MRWGWEDWRIAHLIRKEFATKVGRWQRLNYCNMIRTRREKNITILCWRMLFCNIGNFKFNLLLLMEWVQQLVYLKVHISADHCYILIIYTYITRIFFLAQQKKCFSLPPKSNSECFHQLLQMLLATESTVAFSAAPLSLIFSILILILFLKRTRNTKNSWTNTVGEASTR